MEDELVPLDDPKFLEFQANRERIYHEMNDWLFEIENYGMRIERMYEEIGPFEDIKEYAVLLRWLEAAFNAGKNGR